MFKNKAVILFSIIIFSIGNSLFNQEDIPVLIFSSYKEKLKEILLKTGKFEIHYKDIKLFADWAELNTKNKDVHTRRNVSIHLSNEFISAEDIHIDLESSEVEIKEGFGRIQPTIFYEQKISKEKI